MGALCGFICTSLHGSTIMFTIIPLIWPTSSLKLFMHCSQKLIDAFLQLLAMCGPKNRDPLPAMLLFSKLWSWSYCFDADVFLSDVRSERYLQPRATICEILPCSRETGDPLMEEKAPNTVTIYKRCFATSAPCKTSPNKQSTSLKKEKRKKMKNSSCVSWINFCNNKHFRDDDALQHTFTA